MISPGKQTTERLWVYSWEQLESWPSKAHPIVGIHLQLPKIESSMLRTEITHIQNNRIVHSNAYENRLITFRGNILMTNVRKFGVKWARATIRSLEKFT